MNNNIFHQKGHRLTKPRQLVLDVLTEKPQSVLEIIDRLKLLNTTVDKVTVYRTLSYFLGLGFVGKTQFQTQEAKYELIDQNHHHHHLVCDICGTVEDIPIHDTYLINRINKITGFHIKSHEFEFFGVCKNCWES
jgi:Fur family transcriptional regulator, ferric uptake regulator